ncbi:hydroxymethylglutaryl-CoA synthase family protein [Pendulispora albinea]|uniref:Hydroxymethylglutaryl-CoA synthase n=1 Tax=Pendulispora albinea TaxID=2741071 RepID=A0ABZ2MAF0_9BACT
MTKVIGIDAYAVYVPRLYVDMANEWPVVRAPQMGEESPEKLRGKVISGVGVKKMAVPDGHEDSATMAAMAAKRLIDENGIDPSDIGILAIGTETTVDQSKSMAAYVLGMLEDHYGKSLPHVGTPQVQFACIGATYALEAAVNQFRAGENTRRYAIIIATDISKYPLRSAGEYTQGAGAVALLVCENPRLLELEPGVTGTVTRNERDFFRPNWSSTAVVDGKYSIDVYLDCIEGALSEYTSRRAAKRIAHDGHNGHNGRNGHDGRNGSNGAETTRSSIYGELDHLLFHVPFPRMAEYAAARVFSTLWESEPSLAGELHKVRASLENPDDRRELQRALMKSEAFRAEFSRRTEPSLELSREIGNVYSASLYLAFASLIEQAVKRGQELEGQRVLFCSYGSGASAKVFSGKVAPRWREVASRARFAEELRPVADGGRRVEIDVNEYERLHGHAEVERGHANGVAIIGPPRSVLPPRGEFVLARLGDAVTPKITDHGYRYYAFTG